MAQHVFLRVNKDLNVKRFFLLKLNVQKKNEIIIDKMLQIQTREVVKRLFRKIRPAFDIKVHNLVICTLRLNCQGIY